MANVKAVAKWLYNWVTVIVASLVGVPELVVQALSYLDGVDISPIFGPDLALKIVTGVAVAKAVLSLVGSAMLEDDE